MAPAILFAMCVLWMAADDPGNSIVFDRDGRQGPVSFDHAAHVKDPPDPLSAHEATAAATCGGCHHTRDGKGVIQLAKCGGCHGPEGDPRNPKSPAFDEENRKSAYHEMCIGCHANLAKVPGTSSAGARTGPIDCADCHKMNTRGRG